MTSDLSYSPSKDAPKAREVDLNLPEPPKQSNPASMSNPKIGACTHCRHLKMRCIREEADPHRCQRCSRLNRVCLTPSIRKPGRTKGVKSKPPENVKSPTTLLHPPIISISQQQQQPSCVDVPLPYTFSPPEFVGDNNNPSKQFLGQLYPPTSYHPMDQSLEARVQFNSHVNPPSLPRQPSPSAAISNPLGLLVEASEAVYPSVTHTNTKRKHSAVHPQAPKSRNNLNGGISSLPTDFLKQFQNVLTDEADPRIQALDLDKKIILEGINTIMLSKHDQPPQRTSLTSFRTFSSTTSRDLGHDLDPIELALLSEEEAAQYFDVFFTHLHPLITVLDPDIHTIEFIRSRSAFLLTIVCLNGALFTENAIATSKRLRVHAERLASIIYDKKMKSLEIVQATLIWMPWLQTSEATAGSDRSWRQTTYALEMALELGVNRPLFIPTDGLPSNSTIEGDLENIDIYNFDMVIRMKRNRERTWLRFFLWETALALAFGRGSVFVEDDLIKDEDWFRHPLALIHDREACALVRLRRYFISLSNSVRYRLQNYPNEGTQWIKPFIDESLDQWKVKWLTSNQNNPCPSISVLYMELIYTHGRLWIMSCGLPRGKMDAKSVAVAEDCLTAALESCKGAVSRLRASRYFWYMPNTVGPMLAYAGVLSLHLFESTPVSKSISSRATLFGLLANLAILLENVGSTPSHRFGTAMVYGQHLKVIIRRKISALWNQISGSSPSLSTGSDNKLDPALRRPFSDISHNSDDKEVEFTLTEDQHQSKRARTLQFDHIPENNNNGDPDEYNESLRTSTATSSSWPPRNGGENMIIGNSGTGSGWGDEVRNMLEFLYPSGEGF